MQTYIVVLTRWHPWIRVDIMTVEAESAYQATGVVYQGFGEEDKKIAWTMAAYPVSHIDRVTLFESPAL